MSVGLACAVLISAAPAAEPERTIEGMGRITVGVGYRATPNEYFYGKAADVGTPAVKKSIGGPAVVASFGYAPLDWLEVAIDLFGGYDGFELAGAQPYSAFTYGALLGVRITKMDWPFRGFVPYLNLQLGPTLSVLNTGSQALPEKLQSGYAPGVGFTWRFAERFGLSFDFKWIYARAFVPDVAGINVGGFFFTLGFTVFFPAGPKTPLDVR